MADDECERCEAAEEGGIMAHQDYELIAVEDGGETKYFCPLTMERVRLWDDWEEMTEEEQANLPKERAVLVTPAVYRVEILAKPTSNPPGGTT